MGKRHTGTKRFTIITRYGEHLFQYVTTNELKAKGRVAVLAIWDEGACSARRVVNNTVMTEKNARAHAKSQIDNGRFWKHEADAVRCLVLGLRRIAGTETRDAATRIALGLGY